ncbi:MAG: hypothetical protein AMXMBFR34_53550 [Myxococcaceae bacterium]
MRFILVALLAVHGLIHLLGFVKAFGLAEVSQLKHPISRTVGVLWLVAALLLVTAALLVAAVPGTWWGPAVVGVALSQVLIITSWGDAKFGTVANVLLAVPLVVSLLGLRESSFPRVYERAVAEALAETSPQPVLTDADLTSLPPVVQKFLRRVGVVGKPRVQSFRIVWNAKLRQSPDSPWMEAPTEQVNTVTPVRRLFLMRASLFGVPFVALHRYLGTEATMEVEAAELVTVADARGETMSRSETVTVLNDFCLAAPAVLVDPRFSFFDATEREVTVTFTNGPHSVSARLFFNEDGDLVNFRSEDRFKSADGTKYENFPWSTPVPGYVTMRGLRLPSGGAAVWHEPSGDWTYGEFELVDIEYNLSLAPVGGEGTTPLSAVHR